MRLAVFSDIHGNVVALDAMMANLAQHGEVDKLWCLGDLVAFGPRPAETMARIHALRQQFGEDKLQIIGGNTDRYLVSGERPAMPSAKEAEALDKHRQAQVMRDAILNWNLSQLSWEDYDLLRGIRRRELHERVEQYGDILGVHAIPGSDESPALRPDSPDEEARDALLDREGRLVLTGHTHQVLNRDLGRWRVINPGSVGMSFSQPGNAEWALLEFTDGELSVQFHSVPYALEAVLADAETSGHPHPAYLREQMRA